MLTSTLTRNTMQRSGGDAYDFGCPVRALAPPLPCDEDHVSKQVHRPPKGDPKMGIGPRNNLKDMFRSLLRHLMPKSDLFSGSPFSDPPLAGR